MWQTKKTKAFYTWVLTLKSLGVLTDTVRFRKLRSVHFKYLCFALSHWERFMHECVASFTKSFSFIYRYRKNLHWLIMKSAVTSTLIQLITCTVWIILQVCFGKGNVRNLFPLLYKTGMYSYFSEFNSGSKLDRLSYCTTVTWSWFYLFTRNKKILFPCTRQWSIFSRVLQPSVSPLPQRLSHFLSFFKAPDENSRDTCLHSLLFLSSLAGEGM